MKTKIFNDLLENIFEHVRSINTYKLEEYNEEAERLHHFEKLSQFRGYDNVHNAILDCWSKHIVSLFDMPAGGKKYPIDVWVEKVQDNVLYSILLLAAECDKQGLLPDKVDGDDCIDLDDVFNDENKETGD